MIDKSIRIHELAAAAGVSPSTVSRVLNHPEQVKKETVAKVTAAMESLKFSLTPPSNEISTQDKVILVNLPSIDNVFFNELIRGVHASAHNHACNVIMTHEKISFKTLKPFLKFIKSLKIAGIIFLERIDSSTLEQISAAVPVIQCNEFNDEVTIPHVTIDDYSAARSAVEYLLSKGYNKIGMVNSSLRYRYAAERYRGFSDAVENAEITVPRNWIIQLPEVNYSMAFSTVSQLLSSPNRPDAFFAVSDMYAAAIINAARKNHLRVPRDIAVMGFDNVELSTMCSPTITTVSVPQFQLGYTSCEMLFDRMQNPDLEISNTILPVELIIRESA